MEKNEEHKLIDLQLPNQDLSQIMLDIKQGSTEETTEQQEKKEPVGFKEKTVDSLKRPLTTSKEGQVTFKKRTSGTVKRNIRSRELTD